MSHTVQLARVALPLGLLLAGCTAGHGTDFRAASTSSLPERTTAQDTDRGSDHPAWGAGTEPTSRPVQLLGYTIAPEPEYDITLEEIRNHLRDKTAVIIDARGPADFARGHVRGALNMPAGSKEAYIGHLIQVVAPDQLIIVYCNGPHCHSGDMVYEYLASQGFTEMRVFKPGWDTLSAANDLR